MFLKHDHREMLIDYNHPKTRIRKQQNWDIMCQNNEQEHLRPTSTSVLLTQHLQ